MGVCQVSIVCMMVLAHLRVGTGFTLRGAMRNISTIEAIRELKSMRKDVK